MKIKNLIMPSLITILAVLYMPAYTLLRQYDTVHYTMNAVIVTQMLYPAVFGILWTCTVLMKEQKSAVCFAFAAINAVITVVAYKGYVYAGMFSIYTIMLTVSFLVCGICRTRK